MQGNWHKTVPNILLLTGLSIGIWEVIQAFYGAWDGLCHETQGECLREWTGALSGWAAAIAAGVTVCYLRHQIVEMKLQVQAMDRQTAFVVGDTRPSLSINDSQPRDHISIRLTNWNRRPVVVTRIEAEIPNNVFEIRVRPASSQMVPYEKGYTEAELTKHRTIVAGWEDRSSPPPFRIFDLFVAKEEAIVEVDILRCAASIRFHVTMLGDQPTNFVLKVIIQMQLCGYIQIHVKQAEEDSSPQPRPLWHIPGAHPTGFEPVTAALGETHILH